MALGVLAPLHKHGPRVPHDISIVGFDNDAESPYYIPALTTVEQSFDDLGMTAVDCLLAVIKNPKLPPQQSHIPTHLVK